ncbi:hypothetical protein [Endozoicomonas sp.]|uniref:hypothetical protein n=1 Tax=Endozoicomonas sp. TaxID=1892382 RepID=UPI003AF4A920
MLNSYPDESAQPSFARDLQFPSLQIIPENKVMRVEPSAQDEKQIEEQVVNDHATTEAGLTHSEDLQKDHSSSQPTLGSKADQQWLEQQLAGTEEPMPSIKAHERASPVLPGFEFPGQTTRGSLPPVWRGDKKYPSLHHYPSLGFGHFMNQHGGGIEQDGLTSLNTRDQRLSETVARGIAEGQGRGQESLLMSIGARNMRFEEDLALAQNFAANEGREQESLLMSIDTRNMRFDEDFALAQNFAANEGRGQNSLMIIARENNEHDLEQRRIAEEAVTLEYRRDRSILPSTQKEPTAPPSHLYDDRSYLSSGYASVSQHHSQGHPPQRKTDEETALEFASNATKSQEQIEAEIKDRLKQEADASKNKQAEQRYTRRDLETIRRSHLEGRTAWLTK